MCLCGKIDTIYDPNKDVKYIFGGRYAYEFSHSSDITKDIQTISSLKTINKFMPKGYYDASFVMENGLVLLIKVL